MIETTPNPANTGSLEMCIKILTSIPILGEVPYDMALVEQSKSPILEIGPLMVAKLIHRRRP